MAVFISTSTNAFAEVFEENRQQVRPNVRRPLRGIQVKEDTYAVIRVLTATGRELPLLDSGSPVDLETQGGVGGSTTYSNFIIQDIQEARAEKQQIVETFGEDYVFFFGERPRFLNVSGVLLNTADFNWKSEFWENYERYLRGTRLVENNARMYLYFDDVVVEGYLVNAATTQSANSPYHLPFQFSMFVSNYAILSSVGSMFYQNAPLAGLPPEGSAAGAVAAARQVGGGSLTGFLAATQQFANSATFSIQNALENIRNTFYGRRLVVPEGIGQTLYLPPLENLASFQAAETNRPIWEQSDEYVGDPPTEARFDKAEIARVNAELALRDPKTLEIRARTELEKLGVDTSRPSTSYLLLGRGAFAATQYMGTFGIRQASGALTLAGANGANVNIPGF